MSNPLRSSRPHSSSSFLRLLALGVLALLGACASTGGSSVEAEGTKEEAESGKDAEAEHALRVAQLELKKTKMELESQAARAEEELRQAAEAHEAAVKKLGAFEEGSAIRLASAELSLDRARGNASDSELELKELEAMYGSEEFAEMTKELVLNRGRRQLEHARRGLELEERKMRRLTTVELPAERTALENAQRKAEENLRAAERSRAKGLVEAELSLARAEEALRKAKEKLDS